MLARRSLLTLVAVAALLVSGPLTADTDTWSGASLTTNNFSDTANWVGGTPPIAAPAETIPALSLETLLALMLCIAAIGAFVVRNV